MPSKTEEYLALAQRTANGLTRYWESWTDYLTTASRLYKYPFADQLMIYAQRPDATACAEFDIWRNRMNRYVRRGSKGIALLDESSGFPRLHYVFDVSDTGVRRNSRDPEMWQYNDDLKQPVSEMLSKTYGISGERVSQQLADVAGKLVADYWDNNGEDIRAIVDGSLLMDYDEAGVEMQFKSAAAISVTYTLLERCGLEPAGWFDKDDFQAIYNFSTPDSVYALGAAVSDMSREVLRNIERTVKTTIRRRNAERSQYEYEQQERDLLYRRGLPTPEPDPQPAEDSVGQVRQDAPELSEAASPGAVQLDAPERNAVPAPNGGGADGREPDAADDGRTAEAEPSPGQGEEPDELGEAHEQPAGANRGNHSDGADLQLSFLDAAIPTEAEQIKNINRAESEKSSSAFVLSQAEIENELRKHGSGFTGGKQRIMALYQTQPDRKLRAKALAKEYGIGGHSHDFLDGSRGFVNHDWKGLEFDHYPDHQKITLKWAQVEKYIDLMIQSDRYLTDEEKEQRATRQEASNYNVGDEVVVDLPTRTIEGTIGYVGETDVRIDTSAHGQSWDNEVINKQQFEQGLRQSATAQRVDKMLAQAEAIAKESEVPEYERFSVRKVVDGKMPLFAIWDDLYDDYYETNHAVPQFSNEKQAESYLENLKKEVADREAAEWLKVEHAKFLADKDEPEPSDEELDELPISAVMDGEVQTFPDAAALDEALNAAPAGNFRITDDHLGEGGAKQKYARNIEAIRTLFRLEEEHRGATAEEQQVLSQYVGWGGLADAFDPGKDSWAKEYAELKGLLSEDEYAAARSSTLNAHYTSPTVIRGIYDAVERMGFRSGNILEPSMGVGNFFGMLPDTMQDSRLYGVELDSITGRIAKKLYPQADITVAGFETTDRRDFYDLAVGNVPFGQYKVNDKAYNKLGFSIHNYFFAKAIDQVRPGGIIAFVTSRYTMDSKDSTARKHMAERADLLGAIRLPNNAFRANAGTDVVSDIIFLQKRNRPIDHEPDWVQLGKTEDGFAINQYFVDHPEMVLGQLTTESTQYGREELTVVPIEGANLGDQLAEAVQHIEGQYTAAEVDAPDIAEEEATRRTLPADPEVKNFSYTVVDGEVFYRENSVMTQVELSDTAKGRVTGMVELRQIVNELIQQQLEDYPDADIKAVQERLNAAYDAFTAKYGLLNDRKNGRLFEQDSSYYLLCSLENLDEQGQLKSKAAMFTKRTIRPERTVTSVDTPSEALAVSIGERGKVDLPYMAELLGTPGEYGRITTDLSGVIFKDPAADPTDPEAGWQMADEYLSGNVRAKLRMAQFAAETNPEFAVNVEALTKAQPRELEASEIDVRLGATWLDPDIIQKFMTETFQIPYYLRHAVKVRYSPYTAEWRVEGKTATGRSDIISSETYGTSRANAYKILEETLNLKDVRIYDTIEDAEGKPKRVLNKRETMLAQQKQQVIKDAFANWVWQDPQRRIALVKQYNELFNSTRPREYDGSHIKFVGMNPEITLREHQRNAINDIIISAIQQNIGMVIFQIVVSCLHCIIHDIFRTSDMEIRMGHMDVLIRILLDKVQLSGACRAAPHDHRFGGPAVLAARQQHRPACFCFRGSRSLHGRSDRGRALRTRHLGLLCCLRGFFFLLEGVFLFFAACFLLVLLSSKKAKQAAALFLRFLLCFFIFLLRLFIFGLDFCERIAALCKRIVLCRFRDYRFLLGDLRFRRFHHGLRRDIRLRLDRMSFLVSRGLLLHRLRELFHDRFFFQFRLKFRKGKASAIQQLTGKDIEYPAVLRHLLTNEAKHEMRQLHRVILLSCCLDRTVQHKCLSVRIQIDNSRFQIDLARIQQIFIAFFFRLAQRQEKVGQPGLVFQDPCSLLQRRQTRNVVQQTAVSVDPLHTERQKTGDLVRDQHPSVYLIQLLFITKFSLKIDCIALCDNSIFLHSATSFPLFYFQSLQQTVCVLSNSPKWNISM